MSTPRGRGRAPRKRPRSGARLASAPRRVHAEAVEARPLLPAGEPDVGARPTRNTLSAYALHEGTPILLYLHSPKEKVWGLLVSLGGAGVVVRGLDLQAFEEWLRQEARGSDEALAPSTVFYPLHRLERLERDESVGMVVSLADRFAREVGRTVQEAMGLG